MDHFTLNTIAGQLLGFQPPTDPFDPQDDWELAYGIFSLGGSRTRAVRIGRVGNLRIRRRRDTNDGTVLNIDCEKRASGGYRRQVTAELHCRADALATPVRWSFASHTLSSDGELVENTALAKTAAAERGKVEIRDGKSRRTIDVPSAFTVNWALFEAVQRLPRKAFEPLRFTMLDHFDQVKRNQVLSYRKTADVLLGERRVLKHRWEQLEKGRVRKSSWALTGGQVVRLHAYDQVGAGIVPWVYWVDDQGRLLFVIAGLEAYILDSPKASTK